MQATWTQPVAEAVVLSNDFASRRERPRRLAGVKLPRIHPHMLRHTFVTTCSTPVVDLRDVQVAARYADSRITLRDDRPRKSGPGGRARRPSGHRDGARVSSKLAQCLPRHGPRAGSRFVLGLQPPYLRAVIAKHCLGRASGEHPQRVP